jgi:hypothetical protein
MVLPAGLTDAHIVVARTKGHTAQHAHKCTMVGSSKLLLNPCRVQPNLAANDSRRQQLTAHIHSMIKQAHKHADADAISSYSVVPDCMRHVHTAKPAIYMNTKYAHASGLPQPTGKGYPLKVCRTFANTAMQM